MPEITVYKTGEVAAPEGAQADAVRSFLFGYVDGLGEQARKRWRRFWTWFMRAEPGEMATITTRVDRSTPYHRRHMAMEAALFDAQERFDDFDQFRVWLKIGAGHVDWLPGPKGGIVPVARSISYAALEQGLMQEVHEKMVAFMRTAHAGRVMWPHLNAAARLEMVERVLRGFDE